ncbi:LamG domain-containing protein [Candidatus Poribacteria bacterium]
MKGRHLLIGVVVLFVVGLLVSSSYAEIDPETCIGMWLFDEGSGDIASDSSASKNDGTLMNGAEWVDGKFGDGVSFDGVDDFVELASQPDSIMYGFTFSAWVMKNADNPATQEVFNNHQFFLRTKPEGEDATNPFETFVNLDNGTVEPRASSGVASDIEEWFFVAATWDKITLRIYVNGEFKGQSARTGDLADPPVTAQIGRGEQRNLTANTFNGIIDDVAIFSVVLEEEDIKTLMDRGLKDALVTAVDLSGKLTTTWAGVKTH